MLNLIIIVATSALVTKSFGANVDSVLPVITPLPHAHWNAAIAYSENIYAVKGIIRERGPQCDKCQPASRINYYQVN